MTDIANEVAKSVLADNRKQREAIIKKAIELFHADELKATPEADAIPMMSKAELEELKTDIGRHGGLIFPIVLNKDAEIIDGRNRAKAMKELGADISESSFKVALNGKVEGLNHDDYVYSTNIVRRQLSQKERKSQVERKWASVETVVEQAEMSKNAKDHAKRAANLANGEVREDDPAVSLNKLVCEAIDVSERTATRKIKLACEALGITVEKGHRWKQSEAQPIITYLKENPNVKTKPRKECEPDEVSDEDVKEGDIRMKIRQTIAKHYGIKEAAAKRIMDDFDFLKNLMSGGK